MTDHDKEPISWPFKPEQLNNKWIGLTDEEIHEADCVRLVDIGWGDSVLDPRSVYQYARTIEAKLKEKNT